MAVVNFDFVKKKPIKPKAKATQPMPELKLSEYIFLVEYKGEPVPVSFFAYGQDEAIEISRKIMSLKGLTLQRINDL